MIKLQCIGYVGNEPTIRNTESYKIATFSLGCKQGKEATTWIDCSAFDRHAEVIENYVHKGHQLFIDGVAKLNTYKAKDGTDKTSLQCTISQLEFVGSKQKDDSDELPF